MDGPKTLSTQTAQIGLSRWVIEKKKGCEVGSGWILGDLAGRMGYDYDKIYCMTSSIVQDIMLKKMVP